MVLDLVKPGKSHGEKVKTESVLISSGYVKDIQSNLFGGNEDDMAVVMKKYRARQPAPVSSQFGERLPKAEAVERQLKRKGNVTVPCPSGMCIASFMS